MIAISVFAVVSLLSMGGMNYVLSSRENTEQATERFNQYQMLFMILGRELQQLSNRPVRDEYGASIPSITSEISDGRKGIEFTHQGRYVIGNDIRLQRVAYFIEDRQVIKKTWPVIDRVEDTEALKQVMLHDISSIRFSFVDSITVQDLENSNIWQEDWNQFQADTLSAVRVDLDTPDLGHLYRVFPVQL
jgi:general secretion pathway protein J